MCYFQADSKAEVQPGSYHLGIWAEAPTGSSVPIWDSTALISTLGQLENFCLTCNQGWRVDGRCGDGPALWSSSLGHNDPSLSRRSVHSHQIHHRAPVYDSWELPLLAQTGDIYFLSLILKWKKRVKFSEFLWQTDSSISDILKSDPVINHDNQDSRLYIWRLIWTRHGPKGFS
jgi:hypothetical protein